MLSVPPERTQRAAPAATEPRRATLGYGTTAAPRNTGHLGRIFTDGGDQAVVEPATQAWSGSSHYRAAEPGQHAGSRVLGGIVGEP